jgi:2-(1,2-epoxy-1,2-dihydrophenyl)acetyl-CoA isomerase
MPENPKYETLLYERRNRVALITLNRPDKLNAWSAQLEGEFLDAIGTATADGDTHVIVITGAGRAFCAGGDFSAWSQDLEGRAAGQRISPLTSREGSPEVPIALSRAKPTIAAVNGLAIGIGLTMTLACDIRVASEKAQFSARFVKVGLTPECGSTRYLPLVAGIGNALYLALTGRIVDADEGLRRGLVDRIVPHEKLLDEALALADEIAANPPSAAWAAKRLIHENAVESDLRRVVNLVGFAIREVRRLPDHAEAVQAFIEKRQPNFSR